MTPENAKKAATILQRLEGTKLLLNDRESFDLCEISIRVCSGYTRNVQIAKGLAVKSLERQIESLESLLKELGIDI